MVVVYWFSVKWTKEELAIVHKGQDKPALLNGEGWPEQRAC